MKKTKLLLLGEMPAADSNLDSQLKAHKSQAHALRLTLRP